MAIFTQSDFGSLKTEQGVSRTNCPINLNNVLSIKKSYENDFNPNWKLVVFTIVFIGFTNTRNEWFYLNEKDRDLEFERLANK